MEIILIKLAIIFALWFVGMLVLNKTFSMILKRNEQIHIKFLRSISKAILTIIAFVSQKKWVYYSDEDGR